MKKRIGLLPSVVFGMLCGAAGVKRGRRILISVRVPQNPDVAFSYGMDVKAWVEKGYIDWLISSNSYDSYSLTDDFRRWQEIVGDGALVIPATDSGMRPYRGAKFRPEMNHAAYCGWADLQWTRGAKGLYLFNFQYAHPLLSKNMLSQGLETDALKKRDARYVLTYQDLDPATGDGFVSPLPKAIGKNPVEFRIECGERANGRKSSVLLGLGGENTHFWEVTLNGQIPVRMTRSHKKTPMPANREVVATFECEFPAGTAKSGTNAIAVAPAHNGATNRVVWCEISTKPW